MNAIEQLKSVLCDPHGKCFITGSTEDRAIVDRALQALAAQQEPVGEVQEYSQRQFDDDGCVIGSYSKKTVTSGVYKLPHGTKLYTTPPAQRQWVGLTDEEILKLAYPIRWQEVDDFEADKAVNFAQMVEAKLRSKNENNN